jgi:hypothetical protein
MRKRKLIVGVLALIAAGSLLYCTFAQKDPVVRKWVDVDIRSGRLRTTKKFFGLFTTQHVGETELSKALAQDGHNAQPVWRHCYAPLEWRFLDYSWKEYSFTEAPGTLRFLEEVWDNYECPVQVRRKMAHDIVTLWEKGGDDKFAYWYLDRFGEGRQGLQTCFSQVLEAQVYAERKGPKGIEQVFRFHDGSVMCVREKPQVSQ